jgi:PAS domain S-box-containing protein
MASVLERGGFRVQFEVVDSADNFREHLGKAEYDVILADFNLRSWTAFDALEIVRGSGRDIPLVVVTGGVGDEAAAECLKQGAADYVLKDRPSRLPAAVQRVLAEKRLRTENRRAFGAISRLATIVESSDDAIIGKTVEGVITSWNKGAEELYGYAAAEVVGRPVSILFPPERSEELAPILAQLGRGERVEHFESVRVRKDGSLVEVSLSMFPLTGPGGEVIGAASIARDITEPKRAEAALKEERHLLFTLMDNLPDLIYFKDRESRFTRINLALARKFNLDSPAQALGKTDLDFLPAEHAEAFHRDDADLLRTGLPIVGKEEKGNWPDGEVTWLSTTKMPLRDARGEIVGTFGILPRHHRA